MIGSLLKRLLPDRPTIMTVWRGPFRGARIVANPRTSLRKVLGLYEHELNAWVAAALPRVGRVIDVGANDGYFSLGGAAVMRRTQRSGEIICFEPQPQHLDQLRRAIDVQPAPRPAFRLIAAMVGDREAEGMTTLDALPVSDRDNTLIKIDVEGAELAVIAGARSWLRPSNLFLIEVHDLAYVEALTRTFAAHGLTLVQIDQRPLPVLGGELRDADNRWLVSQL
jgi:Methyltransferase FkbM domain